MIATSREQSKRLLAAGVPGPDCVWDCVAFEPCDPCAVWECHVIQPWMDTKNLNPAWSMSRLWDILYKANIDYFEFSTEDSPEQVMESLVNAVIRLYKHDRV